MGAPLPLSYLGGVPKFYLICPTAAVPSVALPEGLAIRELEADPLGLESEQARVLAEAYAVSPDFQADVDDREDAVLFWQGEWGPPVVAASLGAFDGDRLVGLSYVCERTDGRGRAVNGGIGVEPEVEQPIKYIPLLADLVVEPGWQGRGVGAALLSASAAALAAGGFPTLTLAVHPDNLGALSLYARMGFRMNVEGCVEGDSIAYRTAEQFQALHAQFDSVLPGLELPVECYCVKPVGVAGLEGFDQYVNRNPLHRLPVRVLGMVTGHRSGSARIEVSRRVIEDAVSLLGPAEAATIFDHPNLWSWQRALATGATRFEVCFGEVALGGV